MGAASLAAALEVGGVLGALVPSVAGLAAVPAGPGEPASASAAGASLATSGFALTTALGPRGRAEGRASTAALLALSGISDDIVCHCVNFPVVIMGGLS